MMSTYPASIRRFIRDQANNAAACLPVPRSGYSPGRIATAARLADRKRFGGAEVQYGGGSRHPDGTQQGRGTAILRTGGVRPAAGSPSVVYWVPVPLPGPDVIGASGSRPRRTAPRARSPMSDMVRNLLEDTLPATDVNLGSVTSSATEGQAGQPEARVRFAADGTS